MAALSPLVEQGPERTDSVIDEDHLGRMTLGDRALEREVLEIFARQTTLEPGPPRGGGTGARRSRCPYAQRFSARRRRVARGACCRAVGASRGRQIRRQSDCRRRLHNSKLPASRCAKPSGRGWAIASNKSRPTRKSQSTRRAHVSDQATIGRRRSASHWRPAA